MNTILSLLLPGFGQMLRGDFRKAGTIFGSAVITGWLTAGLGWLACGVWSVVDLTRRSSPAAAAGPGNSAPLNAAGAPSRAQGSAMAWVFKFTTLALCAAIVFQTLRSGNVLQSLEFVGVKLHFGSALASRAEQTEGGSAFSDLATGSVLPSGTASGTLQASEPPIPEAIASVPPASGAEGSLNLAGKWSSSEGVTYELRQEDGRVAIREISRILVLDVETASCSGTISGASLAASCETYLGTTGQIELVVAEDGTLVGEYRDYSTGGRVPMRLRR